MYSSVTTDLHASFGNEPMALGSPISPTGHPSQYLPGYLLGDPTPMTAISPGHKMWSPSPPRQTKLSLTSPHTSSLLTAHGKDKGGAPPVKSLFDTLGSPAGQISSPYIRQMSKSQVPGSMPGSPAPPTIGLAQSFNASGLATDSMYSNTSQRVPPSPAQMDPFYTQGDLLTTDDVLDETWVTVFGFPPAATSYILQQFSQYGNIVKHITSPEGNWIHLHYQSKLQAKKALSKHGKVFASNIMVGVTPCIDKNVMTEDDKENSLINRSHTGSIAGPIPTTGLNTSQLDASTSSSKFIAIRPLTATYRAVRSENEVVPGGQAPQKSNSFVSKAMEYVFGW